MGQMAFESIGFVFSKNCQIQHLGEINFEGIGNQVCETHLNPKFAKICI